MRALKWDQGDHVLIAAPTKAGKTTLAAQLLEKRSHVVMLVTKPKDETFAREYGKWERLERFPRGGLRDFQKRVLIWPRPQKTIPLTIAYQREVMREAMDKLYHKGNRCVCIDEGLYFSDPKYVGMSTELGMMHYSARSSGLSMVTLTQRPSWLPKIVLSSITHGYFARTRDRDDLKKLAEIGSIDAREVGYNLGILPERHDYVYVNPQGDARPAVVNTKR